MLVAVGSVSTGSCVKLDSGKARLVVGVAIVATMLVELLSFVAMQF